eukprot:scaffold1326_cov296-Prasinococcus_capsulatus_cf.AAC.5
MERQGWRVHQGGGAAYSASVTRAAAVRAAHSPSTRHSCADGHDLRGGVDALAVPHGRPARGGLLLHPGPHGMPRAHGAARQLDLQPMALLAAQRAGALLAAPARARPPRDATPVGLSVRGDAVGSGGPHHVRVGRSRAGLLLAVPRGRVGGVPEAPHVAAPPAYARSGGRRGVNLRSLPSPPLPSDASAPAGVGAPRALSSHGRVLVPLQYHGQRDYTVEGCTICFQEGKDIAMPIAPGKTDGPNCNQLKTTSPWQANAPPLHPLSPSPSTAAPHCCRSGPSAARGAAARRAALPRRTGDVAAGRELKRRDRIARAPHPVGVPLLSVVARSPKVAPESRPTRTHVFYFGGRLVPPQQQGDMARQLLFTHHRGRPGFQVVQSGVDTKVRHLAARVGRCGSPGATGVPVRSPRSPAGGCPHPWGCARLSFAACPRGRAVAGADATCRPSCTAAYQCCSRTTPPTRSPRTSIGCAARPR